MAKGNAYIKLYKGGKSRETLLFSQPIGHSTLYGHPTSLVEAKLKPIETFLRSTMEEERLSALAMINGKRNNDSRSSSLQFESNRQVCNKIRKPNELYI